jgi:hypothetical protein
MERYPELATPPVGRQTEFPVKSRIPEGSVSKLRLTDPACAYGMTEASNRDARLLFSRCFMG